MHTTGIIPLRQAALCAFLFFLYCTDKSQVTSMLVTGPKDLTTGKIQLHLSQPATVWHCCSMQWQMKAPSNTMKIKAQKMFLGEKIQSVCS